MILTFYPVLDAERASIPITRNEDGTHTCNTCNFTSKYGRSKVVQHFKAMHELTAKCPHPGCGEEFLNKNILIQHRRVAHLGGEVMHEDDISKQMKLEKDEDNEKEEDEDEEDIPEGMPRKGKKSRIVYEIPNELVRQEDGKYYCDYCDYATSKTSHMRRHISVVHFKNLRYACTECEKKFGSNAALIRHLSLFHDIIKKAPQIKVRNNT